MGTRSVLQRSPHLRGAGQQDAAGGLLLSLRDLGQHQVALGHHLRKVRAAWSEQGEQGEASLPPVSGVPTGGGGGGAQPRGALPW